MSTTLIRQLNQHAVKIGPLGRAESGAKVFYSVPAVNIGLDQRNEDGSPFEISTYLEFAVKIGDKVFYYVVSQHRDTGGWSLEIVTAHDEREERVFGTTGNLALALRNIFSVGTILSSPGKVYDEEFGR